MKKALLLYSKHHFNPEIKKESTASAGVISKSLYRTLIKSGYSVDYIDPSEVQNVKNKKYDLFIGHPAGWVEVINNNEINVKVVFMPTTHPARRNELIRKAADRWGVKKEELLEYKETQEALMLADYVVQIGNGFAVKSLIDNGVPKEKIIHMHYGIEHLPSEFSIGKRNLDNFLHLASGLGLRKGLPETLEIFTRYLKDKKLTAVGDIYKNGPNYEYWKNRIDSYSTKFSNFKYLGYIPSDSKEYNDLLEKQSWLLYPAIEEGEPGTVIEAMSKGVVPLMDRAGSGIDFSITKSYEPVEKQVKVALETSVEGWQKLSQKSKHYVGTIHNHNDWENRLLEIWNKILEKPDFNRPLVSIIIPFFNKEKTVELLLKKLLENTNSYKNYELHIIYDGCKDNTKEKAQVVLSEFNVPVYEYETPDIFEVKSNNLGLRKSNGKYCVIIQDDNFIHESEWLEKTVSFMEEVPRAAVVGGLAGVNFFPLTSNPSGPGVVKEPREVYQRVDIKLTSDIVDKVIEVDAVMRGPLIFRKELLEQYGYLDEVYCPFFNDDMDYCFRMKKLGFSIFYYPISVENKALTISDYSKEKRKFWDRTVMDHQKLFYSKWQNDFGKHQHYIVLNKTYDFLVSDTKFLLIKQINFIINVIKNKKFSIKPMLKKILIKTPLPIKLFFVKKFAQASSLFRKISFNIQIYGVQPRVAMWYVVDGDNTLRLNYDLSEDSVVFDVGGYEGGWSEKVFCKYGSNIHIFEPVNKFYKEIKEKFAKNSKVHVYNFGLGSKNEEAVFNIDGNSSSGFAGVKGSTEKVLINSIIDFIENNNIKSVDLMKINIEGAEYDLLEKLIETGWISKIGNIQVQFHDFIPNAYDRMIKIQDKLKLTHELTYHYEFVWENWKLKSDS
ncbi:MAG: Methyltransferase FkbM family [Parcubacteria group bacterium GW2011_GWA1_44_13]|uniref:Methyltransferase FkbM family n=1 Tax=Candidatus Nomurabacteria bacterium GW2011_GWB1_44_12 TaxID=1618748 RepID=A0A837I7H7_9BACT|nr:MAG: Methyltransferase FkbM family [Candidatus Nomurabacteria bacterium GW2011_GWB1_44_12]KKT38374.1 MAG: Methyltransferase FkbM family [Parcubacteria group bacterium GW2011_GWA1_44_13]KKT60607.1 MAG: type 11 methyltransferase [Parcubacteria group bacterium GW2011_GWC1_44_26]